MLRKLVTLSSVAEYINNSRLFSRYDDDIKYLRYRHTGLDPDSRIHRCPTGCRIKSGMTVSEGFLHLKNGRFVEADQSQ